MLKLPEYSIDLSHPPETDESTTKFFSHDTITQGFLLDDGMQSINTSSDYFTPFFANLVDSPDGISMSDFTVPNFPDLLINAFEHQYQVLMAQTMNTDFRSPNVSASTPLMKATLTTGGPTRLFQNHVSTFILQALLSIMTICAILSWVFMDTSRVLPKNPCSIAALASLLAGSDLLRDLPITAEDQWLDDKQLSQRGLFDGYFFGLGWWRNQGAEPRFGIDIGRPEKELQDMMARENKRVRSATASSSDVDGSSGPAGYRRNSLLDHEIPPPQLNLPWR